jgi:Rieske Fe-S protein
MSLTRREFTTAAGSAIALTVLGCADDEPTKSTRGNNKRLRLPTETFSIGSAHRYREAKVYSTFRKSHGVWITSDGNMLVVLSAVCTHNACGTRYDDTVKQIKCPCHSSRFTSEGLVTGDSRATRALERCRLDEVAGEIQVNPNERFRQDRDEWSSKLSLHLFND